VLWVILGGEGLGKEAFHALRGESQERSPRGRRGINLHERGGV